VPAEIAVTPELQAQLRDPEFMKMIGKKGGKRRLKTMKKRARQQAASHAARMRWSKERIPA
jgi:LPS O-antigen subunit length determinant protein (WzzB/FepE family)